MVKCSLEIGSNLIWRGKEGYCRKNIKEYLYFLNIALGSCGELFSGIISFKEIELISEDDFEILDELHYKVENELISLIKSLQIKQNEGDWEDKFWVCGSNYSIIPFFHHSLQHKATIINN